MPLPPYAGQCGLPSTQPLYAEFGWPTPAYEAIFGKPGIVVGASSGAWPAKMRALGAQTVYFDLNLKNRIGTTVKPADPSLLAGRAKTFFDYAVAQTGCATPVIVLNELAGANLVTPWSDNNAQYRQNALTFVQQLTALGAHPVLLIASRPYTGGDAGLWWQQVAASAEIVREDYVPATATWKSGPVLGNRDLRDSYRQAIARPDVDRHPPSRLGLMISFASTKGFGGRSGLQPDEAWYEVAKWQSLAAQQVAAETGIASVWSWGWGQWTAAEQDPAKPYALCAWLWTRSPSSAMRRKRSARASTRRGRRDSSRRSSPGEQCVRCEGREGALERRDPAPATRHRRARYRVQRAVRAASSTAGGSRSRAGGARGRARCHHPGVQRQPQRVPRCAEAGARERRHRAWRPRRPAAPREARGRRSRHRTPRRPR